jgi:peptide/nickel transport system permease protein
VHVGGTWLLRRIIHSAIVLLGTVALVFVVTRIIPADPVIIMAGQDASLEEIEATRQALGLDKPIYVQFAIYLRNALRGDLGTSLRYHRPAAKVVTEHFPATAQLAVSSMALAIIIAIPAGMIAALKRGTPYDIATMVGTLFGQSVPTFWLGIMLIIVFAVWLRVLPTSGYGELRHMILPTITLSVYMMALIARTTRSSVLEVLGADYLRTARAKGLGERVVLFRHAMRNALIPIVTVIGMQAGLALVGGAVITETVFAWPGIGNLAVDSINTLDYAVVQAVVLLSAFVFVFINLLLDVLYVWIDPRIRHT